MGAFAMILLVYEFVLPFLSRSRFEVSWQGVRHSKGERSVEVGAGVGAGGLGGGEREGERERGLGVCELAFGERQREGTEGEGS